MGGAQDIQSLDKELVKLQKSTRTTVPALLPLHDILRQRYRWYYNWHLWRPAKYLHGLILAVFLLAIGGIFYQFLFAQPKITLAAATTVRPDGDVTAQFVTATPSASHYANVDEASANDNTSFFQIFFTLIFKTIRKVSIQIP